MYRYDNTFCSSTKVGKTGTFGHSIESVKPKIQSVFKHLRNTNTQTPYYKVIHTQNLEKPCLECAPLVKTITENFETHVYVGMGGAILNPMMMHALRRNSKTVHFINTTDPAHFLTVRDSINLANTAFIVISNSGETSETISILGAFINEFKKAGIDYTRNFFFCTSDNDTTLRRIAKQFHYPAVNYDPDVGGRFSSFSNSAVLPAMLMDLDLGALAKGANKVVHDFWDNESASKPVQAALDILTAKQPSIVLISYSSQLNAFLEWYCQIISESLGKNGIGYTPIKGIGPQEQHSLMQLYLDGPKDKLYTLLYEVGDSTSEHIVVADGIMGGHFLEAKPLSTIHKALFDATSKCLVDKSLPLRTIEFSKLNEETFGALLMHCSIEIIFLGLMLGLNPFDQPGVTAIKVEAEKLLSA
jgi:glucose-6-phosphate isomerase